MGTRVERVPTISDMEEARRVGPGIRIEACGEKGQFTVAACARCCSHIRRCYPGDFISAGVSRAGDSGAIDGGGAEALGLSAIADAADSDCESEGTGADAD